MKVYIPCYFNNIKEREDNFYKVLGQYLELNYSIVIYWMNESDILLKNDRLEIIKGVQVNASVARNKLLELFYNSQEDFAILSDDDCFVLERIDSKLDCISFTNDYNKDSVKTPSISSSFMIIKNFNKFYNLKPYFDESLEANQDLDFGLTLNNLSLSTYRKSDNRVIIYQGKSSMFTSNMNKLNKKQKALNYINEKWQIQY